MAVDFVDGWSIIQTLGEGAFGEVKLLCNKQTGDYVAMKIIDLRKHPEAKDYVKKEVLIHRMLRDPCIIQFLGVRSHHDITYMFIEYAPHGELFDKIEPDVGMKWSEAQKYLKQLMSGVEYLHGQGVAHRDLKPENLLLDQNDDLKISDFGLATIFRAKGKERLLDKRCGTLPYVAPEVLVRPYAAEPADVWSCGIILVAMLAGELPWDKADPVECKEYRVWKCGSYTSMSPWSKVETQALSLVRRMLAPLPSTRATIAQVTSHRWTSAILHTKTSLSEDCVDGGRCVRLEGSSSMAEVGPGSLQAHGVYSQPVEQPARQPIPAFGPVQALPFSQPLDSSDMFLPSQGFQLTQSPASQFQNPWQKLVKRMTRFIVALSPPSSVTQLTFVLDKLSLEWKINTPGCVTVSIVDRRKNQLVFKANVVEMVESQTLMDFRLSKGCGLEFKKLFVKIKSSMSEFIVKTPSWTAELV